MNDVVHYFVRKAANQRAFVYPSDIDLNGYYAYGGFYLLGNTASRLLGRYKFPAIHNGKLIDVPLASERNAERFFRAELGSIGTFLFQAQTLPEVIPYAGAFPRMKGEEIRWRLRSLSPALLDGAVVKDKFHFIGYAP